MSEDAELLRRFAEEGSHPAFAELVARKINLVYAAALRRVGGDAHLAHDVTQGVFLVLACRADALRRRAALSAWLHTTTRFVAAKALRAQRRWQRREAEAHTMNALTAASEPAWTELRPVIDEALDELGERDREAILLRFFEGRSLAAVGAAIGLGENAARMRVDRALEKLRARLARRGITSTAAALAMAFTQQPVVAAPAGLAASAASAALTGVTIAGGGAFGAVWSAFQFMGTTKIIATTAGIAAALALGGYVGAQWQRGLTHPPAAGVSLEAATISALQRENRHLKDQLSALQAPRGAAHAVRPDEEKPHDGNSSAVLTRLRVLMALKNDQLANPEIAEMISSAGKLTPAFVRLFALTPDEQDALERCLVTSRERLADLERENATLSRTPAGDVLITVKAFPEAGGAIYDQTLKTFAATLGPDRHQAFLALGMEQVEKALGRFGTPERTLKFSRISGSGAETHYAMQEVFKLPKENGNYSSDFKSFEELTRQAGALARLLPPDFAPRN